MSNHRRSRVEAKRDPTRRDWVTGITLLGVLVGGALAIIVYGVLHNGSGTRASGSSVASTTTLTPKEETVQKWGDQITTAFSPLESVLQPLLQDTESWEGGTGSATTVADDIEQDWPDFTATESSLARQAPLALAPQALSDYQLSVELYIDSTRMAQVATGLSPSPLVHQLQLSSTRIRELGDRIYDQATVVLAPYTPQTPAVPGVDLVKPVDVPVWASIGLAAGPPLDMRSEASPPITYEQTRPQEAFAAWENQVDHAGIPSVTEEVAAIENGTTAELRAQSDALIRATATLTADPDPTNGRVESTRLRLGLLVDAEATRAAEAATLVGPATDEGQLRDLAESLAVVGDRLWDPALGPRATDFPASVLTSGFKLRW